jgi:hypothetical protein
VQQWLARPGCRISCISRRRSGARFANLTRDQAAALQEVTVESYMDGGGENAREVKKVRFKLADKRAALGRHHKLFTDKFEHGGKDGLPIEGKITIEFVPPPKRNSSGRIIRRNKFLAIGRTSVIRSPTTSASSRPRIFGS